MKIKLKVKRVYEKEGINKNGNAYTKVGLLNEDDTWYSFFKGKDTGELEQVKEGDEIECHVEQKGDFWNILPAPSKGSQAQEMLWEELKVLSTRVSNNEIAVRELEAILKDAKGVPEKESMRNKEIAEADGIIEDDVPF